MRVAIAGAGGFVGRHLSAALERRGDTVVRVSLREPSAAAIACNGADVVVNLAGEPVAQRWTAAAKERMRASRVDAPRAFIASLAELTVKPRAYVSASAIGYYGTSFDTTFTEASPAGQDFLAELCVAWEREAQNAAQAGMRVTIVRTGIALGTQGGALAKLLPPFRFGLGGPIASGAQWFSWVHIDDLAGIYLAAIDGLDGVLNATAPQPVRNLELTQTLGRVLHRPAIVPVPPFALRLLLGEGALTVTEGQRVLPERPLELGYAFKYAKLEPALKELLDG